MAEVCVCIEHRASDDGVLAGPVLVPLHELEKRLLINLAPGKKAHTSSKETSLLMFCAQGAVTGSDVTREAAELPNELVGPSPQSEMLAVHA
jgi:hypothetical protein